MFQKMNIYQTDAFTDTVFKGNPAAIIPLDEWLDTETMQNIAAENNLSETAYFVKNEDGSFRIRWFTPQTEVDLCGHATLASAHVLYEHLGYAGSKVVFHSHSGELTVEKSNDMYWMNFPSRPPEPIPVPKLLPEAIGVIPLFTGVNTDMLVLVQDENMVRELKPDLNILKRMEVRGTIVTAPADDPEVDFVSRFFAPAVGVPEDPVTGSAHTILSPFWSKRLDKDELKARQISQRGGELHCIQKGERVYIGGKAVTYLIGEIFG
jgi:PhzF family phenazine biosynthesis protein